MGKFELSRANFRSERTDSESERPKLWPQRPGGRRTWMYKDGQTSINSPLCSTGYRLFGTTAHKEKMISAFYVQTFKADILVQKFL